MLFVVETIGFMLYVLCSVLYRCSIFERSLNANLQAPVYTHSQAIIFLNSCGIELIQQPRQRFQLSNASKKLDSVFEEERM